jgi:hypothetical protein
MAGASFSSTVGFVLEEAPLGQARAFLDETSRAQIWSRRCKKTWEK